MQHNKLLIGINNWEYSLVLKITTEEKNISFVKLREYSTDSLGKEAPDTIIIGKTLIELSEGFETLGL